MSKTPSAPNQTTPQAPVGGAPLAPGLRALNESQQAALNNHWEKGEPLTPGDYPFFSISLEPVELKPGLEPVPGVPLFGLPLRIDFLGLTNPEFSKAMPNAKQPDQIEIYREIGGGVTTGDFDVSVQGVTLHVSQNNLFFLDREGRAWQTVMLSPLLEKETKFAEENRFAQDAVCEAIRARNEAWGIEAPRELQEIFALSFTPPVIPADKKPRELLPVGLAHPTFIEARQFTHALSDGRDGRNWAPIEGAIALLHCAPKSTHSVRFEPSARLLNWWGTSGVQPETLLNELARLDLDDVILFRVVLSAVLHSEKARFSASLDDIITLIGRDTDARRSAPEREKWRARVWRSIVLFDSLAVIGKRGGTWKEPAANGEKRVRMDAQTLYTRDPLLLISGTRDTEQGTFDGSAPPKTVSLVPGDWLMEFHGNREILSEFGDVLPIAQIPRGKPSGAWAACAGLMLSQLWREQATRATLGRNSRGGDSKIEVLKFRPFTRRELLAGTFRSDYDVDAILNDPKGRKERAQNYWKVAVKELKERGVISYYAELENKGKHGSDWRSDWLNQPLDIRPAGEMLTDALEIHKAAQVAKKRSNRKRALPAT